MQGTIWDVTLQIIYKLFERFSYFMLISSCEHDGCQESPNRTDNMQRVHLTVDIRLGIVTFRGILFTEEKKNTTKNV